MEAVDKDEGGRSKNLEFERKYKDLLKPYVEKYEDPEGEHLLP
jgi:hypothetical protein